MSGKSFSSTFFRFSAADAFEFSVCGSTGGKVISPLNTKSMLEHEFCAGGMFANTNFSDCSTDLNTQSSQLIFPSNIYEIQSPRLCVISNKKSICCVSLLHENLAIPQRQILSIIHCTAHF
jgi:hypothetical protein